jgi:hypothetical protein
LAFKARSSQNLRGSCRSRGGRCQGTNGNSSYTFSAEKWSVLIKCSRVWKWCRTFSAKFFDLKVRHLTCLRSFCVEPSGHLPGKLGEGSDESVPMLGFWAESSDKAETTELRAPPKPTLLRPEMKICIASFLLKSTLLFSNESDCGNRVRTFSHEKFG